MKEALEKALKHAENKDIAEMIILSLNKKRFDIFKCGQKTCRRCGRCC